MSEEKIPPAPSAIVAWLYRHGAEIRAVKVDYVMLGVDTSKTVWHVEFYDGHKQTVDLSSALTDALDFYPHRNVPSWRAIAALKEPLRKQCEERAAWEKKHNRELAEYKRLKAKFE